MISNFFNWLALRLVLTGVCVTGFASAQHAVGQPITVRLKEQGGNDYYSVVVNRSESELTAYSIVITRHGDGRRIRKYYDVRMLGLPAVKPGASVEEYISIGIPVAVAPLAAVFADGSTFGDAREVADLMKRRNIKLSALSEMASILCDAQRNTTDSQNLIGSLEAGKLKVGGGSAMDSLIVAKAFDQVINQLKRSGSLGPAAIAAALQGIQASGGLITEDPIKDPNGNPYINVPPARLTCR